MKTWKNNNGYLSVYVKGRGKVMLHRYIWETQNGAIQEGMEIHHIDGDKENNDITNLQIIERKLHRTQHLKDRDSEIQAKFIYSFKGKKHTKLTKEKISRANKNPSEESRKKKSESLKLAWAKRKLNTGEFNDIKG